MMFGPTSRKRHHGRIQSTVLLGEWLIATIILCFINKFWNPHNMKVKGKINPGINGTAEGI